MLTDVYLEPRLAKNIVSYGKLEIKGFALFYDGEKRALARRSDAVIAFDVVMQSNMLYVDMTATEEMHDAGEAIMAAFEAGATTYVTSDVQKCTLLHFH